MPTTTNPKRNQVFRIAGKCLAIAAMLSPSMSLTAEAQSASAGFAFARHPNDKAGILTGYFVALRTESRGPVVRWQDVEGNGVTRHVFCGALVDPGTDCPLEQADIRTRVRNLAFAYALPVFEYAQWSGSVSPQLSWVKAQSEGVGRETGRRQDFDKTYFQAGFGVETFSPQVLRRIRLQVGFHAALAFVSEEICLDCQAPLFQLGGIFTSLNAGVTYYF